MSAMQRDESILFVISTTAGWSTIGDRLALEIGKNPQRYSYVPYTSNSLAKRLTQHKDYHKIPLHLPIFDAFTVNRWQSAHIRRTCRSFDVVVAGHVTQAAAMMGTRQSRPVIAYVDTTRHLHQTAFNDHRISLGSIERERKVFEHCAHVIALSEWASSDLVSHYGVPREKITVIPPPSQKVSPIGHQLKRNAPRLKALFIGRDFHRKGGSSLVNWQRSKMHEVVDLTMVTDCRFFDRSVPNTDWLDAVSNQSIVEKLMPSMDILLLPTTKDCSPLVVGEPAMAGVPTIATAVGGVAELIEDGATGHVVAQGDDSAFVACVQQLARERGRLSLLGAAAHQKAVRDFEPTRVFKRITDCAHQVLVSRQGASPPPNAL